MAGSEQFVITEFDCIFANCYLRGASLLPQILSNSNHCTLLLLTSCYYDAQKITLGMAYCCDLKGFRMTLNYGHHHTFDSAVQKACPIKLSELRPLLHAKFSFWNILKLKMLQLLTLAKVQKRFQQREKKISTHSWCKFFLVVEAPNNKKMEGNGVMLWLNCLASSYAKNTFFCITWILLQLNQQLSLHRL